jgi:hypothetical protein
MWTTASIDVSVDGKTVLQTGGVPEVTGKVSKQFEYDQRMYTATISWTRGALRSFPFTLAIDDAVILHSRVPISNWWMAFAPTVIALAVVFVWLIVRSMP